MSCLRACATLHQRLPKATACFAFERVERSREFSGRRIDLLYVFPAEQHTGLLHWVDELSWYEGETFVVAMELSKFGRLLMKGHPLALRHFGAEDRLDRCEWPTELDVRGPVSAWLPAFNQWLHAQREAASLPEAPETTHA